MSQGKQTGIRHRKEVVRGAATIGETFPHVFVSHNGGLVPPPSCVVSGHGLQGAKRLGFD